MSDTTRIPGSPSPQFLAAVEIVPANRVTTYDQQFLATVERDRRRCGKGLTRFSFRLTGPYMTEKFFTRCRIHRQDKRIMILTIALVLANRDISLQHLQIKFAVK